MRGLKICLWIAGFVCLLSVFGVFLPLSTLESLSKAFGIESLPDSPLFVYAARLMSATYALVGVFFIILALAPIKYGVLVPFSGLAAVLLGVVCAIVGIIEAMPVLWFLGDSLSCIVLGILILFFWRQANRKSEALIETI
jgi:hypothetical protein